MKVKGNDWKKKSLYFIYSNFQVSFQLYIILYRNSVRFLWTRDGIKLILTNLGSAYFTELQNSFTFYLVPIGLCILFCVFLRIMVFLDSANIYWLTIMWKTLVKYFSPIKYYILNQPNNWKVSVLSFKISHWRNFGSEGFKWLSVPLRRWHQNLYLDFWSQVECFPTDPKLSHWLPFK